MGHIALLKNRLKSKKDIIFILKTEWLLFI